MNTLNIKPGTDGMINIDEYFTAPDQNINRSTIEIHADKMEFTSPG